MKTLITTSTKALTLTFVLFSLATGLSIAGGNNNNNDKKAGDDTLNSSYSECLADMKIELAKAESINEEFEMTPKVKIYNSNFDLIKASDAPTDYSSEDKEMLKLIRNSNVLMEFGNITYYLLNE